jgi:hypothetical protein
MEEILVDGDNKEEEMQDGSKEVGRRDGRERRRLKMGKMINGKRKKNLGQKRRLQQKIQEYGEPLVASLRPKRLSLVELLEE